MADERITIEVDIHDGVSGQARVVVKSLDDIGDKAQAAAPKVAALDHAQEEAGDSATQLAARVALAERRVKTMGNEATKSAAKITMLEKRLKSLNRSGTFGFGGGKKGGMFGGAAVGGFKFMKFLKLILIPVIFDAVGAVATLGSALGAMASVAVGGLAPLTGVLAAYPGYLAAIGQGLAATKLGFSGLGKAIQALADPETTPEELAKAMKGLSPTVKILAKDVADLNKPFKAMKKAIGEGLAPGFIDLTKAIRTYMPMVKQALVGTAAVISTTVSRLASFLRESGTQSSVQKIMQTNTGIIRQFGDAALSVFRILLNVLVAAGPMLTKFAQDFARFMDRLASSSDDRKGLTDFFDKTYTVTKKLIRFTSDLSAAFYNVFKIGAGLGSDMGDSFLEMAANFRHFTETVTGQRSIANWFATMKPIIYEVGYLVRDISKGLASISMDKTLLGTLQTLRLDTLPALISMLQQASGKFLPTIAKIIGTLAEIWLNLDIFPVVLTAIANTLEVISTIINALPGPVQKLLGYIVTLVSVIKVGAFVGVFKLFGAGAAGAATKTGLLATMWGSLSAIWAAAGQVFAAFIYAVIGGAGAATTAVALLKAGILALLSSTAGIVAMVAALAAIGWAVLSSDRKMKEAHATTIALGDELRKTSSADAFRKVIENADVLKAKLDDLESSRDSIGDMFSPSYWLRADTWGDAAKTGIMNVVNTMTTSLDAVAGSDNPISSWFDRTFRTAADQTKMDIAQAQADIARAAVRNNALANTIFGTNKDYAEESPELQRINDIKEALGPLPENYGQAQAAVVAYNNVNYEAAPGVKVLYDALNTLNSTVSTSTERVDAFTSVLDGLGTVLNSTSRDSRVKAAKGIDSMTTSMDGAVVSFRKGNLVFKATNKNNWALHDSLTAQASAVEDVAAKTMAQTQDTDKATQAYKRQYDMVVNKLAVGLDISTKQARKLANQYLATPTEINTVFKQPGFKEFLETGPSYKAIRKWIQDHPINVKMGVKKDKALKDPASSVFGAFKKKLGIGVNVGVKVKDNAALADLATFKAQAAAITATPITPLFAPIGLDPAIEKVSNLATATDNLRDKEITITVNYDDGARAMGGPVFAGARYLVGERGPEAFVSNGGVFKMIGVHGQEHRTFPTDGVVVPNHALPDDTRITTALAERTASRPTSSSRREYLSTGNAAPVVNIGTINAKSDIDVIQAVKKGIAEAERNRRERG